MIGQTNEKILSKKLHRTLRTTMTDAEQALWRVLRGRQFSGCKFRRQHPFGDYILDFVCLSNKLVIEVDGGQHGSQTAYDEIRTKRLQAAGFHLLRFWNNEVFDEFEAVKEKIWMTIEELQEQQDLPHPHPNLPLEGEGTESKTYAEFPLEGEGTKGEGDAEIPLGGERTKSKPLALISILLTILLFTGEVTQAEEPDPHPKLSLTLSLGKTEASPGETIPVSVTLRINDATVRNIGYPRLTAPAGGTVSFSPPVQESEADDPNVIRQRFTGQVSGVKPGTLTIGPARLECEVMQAASGSAAFFGEQEAHQEKLTSPAVTITVLPLPVSGRPQHFSGAIGAFSLSVTSLPAQVTIGEPLTITTTIRGTGLLADVVCPAITDPALQSFPVRVTRVAAQLVCEQVVVSGKVLRVPPVVWSYFDPANKQYRTLSAEISSRVIAAPPSPPQPVSPPMPETNIVTNQKPVAVLGVLAAATAFIWIIVVILRKQTKPAQETSWRDFSEEMNQMFRAAETAVANNNVDIFYNISFEIIVAVEKYYSLCCVSKYSTIHEKENYLFKDNELPHKQGVCNALKSLSAACDSVRYGRTLPDPSTITADLQSLRQILSHTLNPTIHT